MPVTIWWDDSDESKTSITLFFFSSVTALISVLEGMSMAR